ncbi:subunits of heterodimeric actin filament capping protein Capz [Tilletiaria anomala UBC 951]|uniref:F-actin-capping protein subunit alpha n=1 Tax=Tilletiaria anomala (strain ATCC 24038 / CBS 436.72 / UBC 951) TaxID=1037660 RepID=A0A066WC61_TILAU|nr:subunits of heterodimeric actin filament capping protein Capz [Tilletiaria anomala UBC 951]KDN51321.1 subunits of heterodimeric actin filament capping protein Capz [Tilletiaria anomala UBC 951]
MSSSALLTAQAVALLLQTPPGQTSKVYHDLRVLLESSGQSHVSDQLKQQAQPVLEQYNTDQLITVKPPASADGKVDEKPLIIARAASVAGQNARYADPKAGLSYAFDHLRLALSDPRPLRVNKSFEKVRAAIDTKVAKYVLDHYQDGVISTFTDPTVPTAAVADVNEEAAKNADEEGKAGEPEDNQDATDDANVAEGKAEPANDDADPKDDAVETAKALEEVEVTETPGPAMEREKEEPEPQGAPTYVTHIVGNRYNLSNFWAGRWRSSYTYTPSSSGPSMLQSSIQVQVHYFEDGNVQLATSKPAELELDLPAGAGATETKAGAIDDAMAEAVGKAIAQAIKGHEQEYHQTLNEAYAELSEKTFKAIRRQLPVTKQKLDWDRVSRLLPCGSSLVINGVETQLTRTILAFPITGLEL